MLRATDLARLVLQPVLRPGVIAIDGTVGNGHDTLWLAQAVGPTGHVYGFDIQAVALANAATRLTDHKHVTLFASGHERLADMLPPEAHHRIAVVMFNLGYLPGADKGIITRADTTIAALTQALDHLQIGGCITIVLYPGHPGGADEAAAVRSFAGELPTAFATSHFNRLNAATPSPELIVLERLR
jgi:predicted methyltransferase